MIQRTLKLNAPPDFSLKATALSHGWHECAPMTWSQGGNCFQIIERHRTSDRDRDSAFRVCVTETKQRARKRKALNVSIDTDVRNAATIEDDVVEAIRSRLRVTLGLDLDLTEFYTMCESDDALAVVPVIGAGRMIRSASMTENILKAICSTNVNWTQAVNMINRLCQLGPNLTHFRNLSAWPTPREILRAGNKYLSDVCRLGYRCDSILKFCDDVATGKLDPESFDAMATDPNVPSEDLVKKLCEINGIGPTSANYLIGFLGRHDRLAIDSATYAHVAEHHTKGRKPSAKKIERLYAKYGKWKNKAAWLENWLTWDTAKELIAEGG